MLIRAAMGSTPGRLDFVGNLGKVLRETRQPETAAAIGCYRRAFGIAPR